MNDLPQNPQSNIAAVSGSALIADFLGLELDIDQEEYPNYYRMSDSFNPENITRCSLKSMEFSFKNSWNWLMPVLEKLCRKEIGDGITYVKYATPRTFGMLNEETEQIMVRLEGFQLQQADTLIEATFLAIVDCLQWLSQADR
jgi:hypothetical protein